MGFRMFQEVSEAFQYISEGLEEGLGGFESSLVRSKGVSWEFQRYLKAFQCISGRFRKVLQGFKGFSGEVQQLF